MVQSIIEHDEDNDDVQVGRILSRREILAILGSAGAVMVIGGLPKGSAAAPSTGALAQAGGTAVPACVVKPELTEGPYFVDEKLNRSDIRSDPSNGQVRPGVLLKLRFNVYAVGTGSCVPLPNAQVDVWHCDALGVYSDVTDRGFSTVGQKFLRGYQSTNANGVAQFTTIYPGWYQGRAVHIHFKIRIGGEEFTSQLFFDDTLSDQIFSTLAPYTQKGANRSTRNSNDNIFRSSNNLLTLQVTKDGDGYTATFDIGLQGVTPQPTAVVTAQPTAQPGGNSYTFTETGITVSGDIWTAWQGGRAYQDSLYLNGLPITPARSELSPTDNKPYLTQWFERARFEVHPENRAPYNVLLGLLGATAAQGRQNEAPFKAIANPWRLALFTETGHTVGDSTEGGQAIARFWTSLGGIQQFGFPISQPFTERNKEDGKQYLVQYYQRQRMEYHPENKGTRFEVLLGRLGAEQLKP